MIAFLSRRKPLSINARYCTAYKQDIAYDYDQCQFEDIPWPMDIYARIYYFYSTRISIDADNISKPILDALCQRAYRDDEQVVFRISAKIDMRDIQEINLTDMPDDVQEEFLGLLGNEKHQLT